MLRFGVNGWGSIPNPGCASRPWALGCNSFGIECLSDHYANGVTSQSPGSPLRRTLGGNVNRKYFPNPGCASRPWALAYNPFGVNGWGSIPNPGCALPNPGCASRPWALVYNPFGVNGSVSIANPGCASRPWALTSQT